MSERTRRNAIWVLFGIALAYALVAGLRTVADFDVGWLLATGRYLVTHHAVPRTEVFSYTVNGTPWTYPVFGGTLLYLLYAIGGFAALSWLNAIACVAVVTVAVGRPRPLTCALAILAVPSLAFRTAPRAEIFTTFFFSAFLAVLWGYRRTGKNRLWLLPLMMLLWVNAHPGFAAGLMLMAAYAAVELLDVCFSARRAGALARLKTAAPWLAASTLATLLNPWGVRVYQGLVEQNKVTALHSVIVGEWSGVRLTLAALAGGLQIHDPNSSYWWLLAFACLAMLGAICRRQPGNALLLLGAAYLSVEHLRFQALFAVVVIVVSAEVFERSLISGFKPSRRDLVQAVAMVIIVALAVLHIADTITNYSYLAGGELTRFGTGLSWWYPERAAEFIERNKLPAHLFHDYNTGGYITLRLGSQYRDFADGRALPFGAEVLASQTALVQSSPDSALWTREADRRGIGTIILSLARFGGLESVPLAGYCESREWKPVYLDDVSIVLVRNRPENQQWISRFFIDCQKYRMVPPSTDSSTARGRAELYNFFANAASIYYLLGRDHDATEAMAQAGNLFTEDPNLPLLAGQLLRVNGRFSEAEAQYRRSLEIRPTDNGWYLMSQLLIAQRKYEEAAKAVQHSADLAVMPAERYRLLGNIQLVMNKPKEALVDFDRAEHFGRKLAPLPSYPAFRAKLAEGRGRAWLALNDSKRASEFSEQAVQLAPDPQRWNLLADCYIAQGRTAEAEKARKSAKEFSAP